MIENLNGTHETVNYRENTSLRIYDNGEYEEYPLHWHSPIEILMPPSCTICFRPKASAISSRRR